MYRKIRAVVVDDSAFMRKSLSIMLEAEGEIEVIGTAKDGIEGYELVKRTSPDIVTLDIEMPRMDGLCALKKIMKDCPTSVLMVSSITTAGAEETLKALEYGAVDFIPKEPSFVNVNIKRDLVKKVKEIIKQKSLRDSLRRMQAIKNDSIQTKTTPSNQLDLPQMIYKAVVIGISTGGPMSLQKVIPLLSKKIDLPIFIVQHMPPKFTKSLADRLDGLSQLRVVEAEDDEIVRGGVVYIAPGGYHLKLKKNLSAQVVTNITEEPVSTLHRPSVDVVLDSVMKIYGKQTLGIIMTGMGKDGLEGIKELKRLGGNCVAQNEESCVVYGMPKAIVEAGFADAIAPLNKISDLINNSVSYGK